MKTKPKMRLFIMALVFLGMMGALIYQLAVVTLTDGEYYAEQAESRSVKTTYTTASRGSILDRNGIPLAYDETSYNVQFSRDPERRTELSALYTESLITAIEIIEDGGGSVIDTFYVKMSDDGTFYYDFGDIEEGGAIYKFRYKEFCNAMSFTIKDEDDMSTWKSAYDAYVLLRSSWRIPEEMPYEDARKIMSIRQEVNMNQWKAYEPITIAYNVSMEVVAQLEMRADELLGISTTQSTTRVYPWGTTAAHILGYMSRQVGDMSESNVLRMGYTEEDLAQYGNVYKQDENGLYMEDEDGGGKIISLTGMGYSTNDYIGVAGIERTMEKYLTASTSANRGSKTIETNMSGVVMRELEETPASSGSNIMLTIDLPLQQVTETALEKAIQQIREYEENWLQEHEEDYSALRNDLSTIAMAETGSIVVLDINNGRTLAMASYPTYDPNIFVKGTMTVAERDMLFGEDSNLPTYNRAIAGLYAPGSIFKLSTGLAGLMEGVIDTDTKLSDGYISTLGADGKVHQTSEKTQQGRYTHFISGEEINVKDAPKCWTNSVAKHASLNITSALAVSCNYYFFTVADALGIERLNAWSTRLGLNDKTNIELPGEQSSHVGGQSALYDNTKTLSEQKSSLPGLVYSTLKKTLKDIAVRADREANATDEAITSCATRILRLQGGMGTSQEFGDDIRNILREELGIPVNLTSGNNWVSTITSLLNELYWKGAMTIRAGMGQGITLTTPVSIARYAAAFGNGGTVYDVHIVDRVTDEYGSVEKVFEPTVFEQIEAPDEYWDAIREGLMQVVSPEYGGTAADAFTDEFQEKYMDQIIGKSGTAQISASNNVDIENTSWFITMLPRDNPEIVIITCLPNGMNGARGSGPAIEEIVRFYIDRKESAAQDNLVGNNGILP